MTPHQQMENTQQQMENTQQQPVLLQRENKEQRMNGRRKTVPIKVLLMNNWTGSAALKTPSQPFTENDRSRRIAELIEKTPFIYQDYQNFKQEHCEQEIFGGIAKWPNEVSYTEYILWYFKIDDLPRIENEDINITENIEYELA